MTRLPPALATAAKAPSPRSRPPLPRPHVPRPPWAPVQLKSNGTPPLAPEATPNLTGLPDGLKAGVEALSGLAMDDVRVHRNSPEPAKLGALAFAQGGDIHLGPGQEQHLPHEAWHIVQQKQGRVEAKRQMKNGVAINDDQGLEREADAMGSQAWRSTRATDNGLEEPAQLFMARTPVTQLVAVSDDDFLRNLGLTVPEIALFNAQEYDTLEDKLYQGIEHGGLDGDGFDPDRLDLFKEKLKSSTDITQNQEIGLCKVVDVATQIYPVAQWEYIGIGRSAVIIIEYLAQKKQATVHELPMGNLSQVDTQAILADEAQKSQLMALINEYVSPAMNKNYLIIDYKEGGNSITRAKELLAGLYPQSNFQSFGISVNEDLPGAGSDANPRRDAVKALAMRLRMHIGKTSLASFKSLDLSQDVSEWIPELNEGGSDKRRAMVAGLG